MDAYDPHSIERHWTKRWDDTRLHRVDLDAAGGAKLYNLVEFPYPSAEGLHVGHVRTYAGADVYGRYQRMHGQTVFQPMGFDSFGINAENFALKIGEHPRDVMQRTTANFRRQLSSFGAAWDWTRVVSTHEPGYYRWTQWLFCRLHEAGLAYLAEAPVVWCPSCRTVLAREQLEGDACERCQSPVTEKRMRQWFLRMTAYADELVDGLHGLDWPEWAKQAQRQWIGRAPGVEVSFPLDDGRVVDTFTTRVDTLFGVTFLALAPSHEIVATLAGDGEVAAFLDRARSRSPSRRFEVSTDGLFTGRYAFHPLTGERVPVLIADYVMGTHGTGAVMGVPAHDERDHAFAIRHGLVVVPVVRPSGPASAEVAEPWTGEGVLRASGPFDGMPSERAREAIANRLEADGSGRRAVHYRLQDWLISRQRYWGPPIPMVHCDECGQVRVPDDDLPVRLPEMDDFRPTGTGVSPLASVDSFVRTPCPSCARPARRETDVSDTFLDSAWYYLRYTSTDRDDVAWDPARVARLLPVDQYEGGQEHVRRHHLYARFIAMALNDLGLLPFREPFPRLNFHGLIVLGGAKMSKSRGNVIGPDPFVEEVGSDNLRLALLSTGPWEMGGEFSDRNVVGMVRFTSRLWRLIVTSHEPGRGGVDLRPLDRAVAHIQADIEAYKFHTAIARLVELERWTREHEARMSASEWSRTARTMVLLLAPFAPHLAEELWSRLGGPYSVHEQEWPSYDADALPAEKVKLAVQIDGKTRATLDVPAGLSERDALERALNDDRVRGRLRGREPRHVVYVADRVLNLVT